MSEKVVSNRQIVFKIQNLPTIMVMIAGREVVAWFFEFFYQEGNEQGGSHPGGAGSKE